MSGTMLIELITNIILLFALVVIRNFFGSLTRFPGILSKSLQGIIIGIIGIFLMYNSFLFRPGVFFDTRTVLLSVSGLFFGFLPTAIAAGVALIYRIWVGGGGVTSGILTILLSAAMGILWGTYVKRKSLRLGWRHNFLFGLSVHSGIILLFFLFLPRPDNVTVTINLLFPYLFFFPLASGLLGRLISYEQDHQMHQEKLLESRELYEKLFHDNQTIMLLIDPETGNVTDANPAAVAFYGWSYPTLTKMNINQLNTAPQEEVKGNIERVKNDTYSYFFARHRRSDNSIRDVEIYSNSIRREGKTLLFSILHDITERRETEIQLRKSEYQLSRAEIIARLGHWELDLNQKSFTASAGAVNIYGVENTRLDMALVQSIPLPEYRDVMNKALDDLITRGTGYDLKFRILRPRDGAIAHIHSLAEYDAEKNTVFGVIHDITAYKKAEDEIQKEKEGLAVTLHSIGDGVITTDQEGRISLMNPIAEEMTGWVLSEAQNRPLPEVFHIIDEYTRLPCPNPVDLVFNTNGIVEMANHTMLISRDGRERIISDSGAPIRDKEGRIIGTVLVFRDTTEKQMLQNRIQRADKLESLGILAGGIAHDFNNLLGGIFGFIELARENSKDGIINEYLDLSLQVYNRTADLTKQLLTFSKGNLPDRKTGNLATLIQDSLTFSLSGSSVSWELKIQDELWTCSYDENQIGQVLDNLLINAKQAMPDGGTILLSAENTVLKLTPGGTISPGNYVRISITDTGEGIPREILPRIFDPFFSTKEMGSGLGLATCYSILEKHNGGIDVETSESGTTFRFYLPAVQEITDVPAHSLETRFLSAGGRILIMDDELFLRQILGEFLSSMGFEVIKTKNGQEAMEAVEKSVQENRFITAAILDLTIPGGMGGLETINRLRSAGFIFPVFATSGYSEDPIIAAPEAYGFTASISKPYRRKELSALLDQYLSC